jgi:hypothetical protein
VHTHTTQTILTAAAKLPIATQQVYIQGIDCLLGVQVLLHVPGCHGPADIQAHAAHT